MSSLQFILGGSGCGKTQYLNQLITKEAKKNSNTQYLVIVPEQFTMQTQKELVMASSRKGILNIDVLSFLRLAFRVFGELGTLREPVIDDLGKMLILRKVLSDEEDNLVYFGKNIRKKGFIAEIKSFLSELIQYDLDDSDIESMMKEPGNSSILKRKLQDIKTAYVTFQNYLKDHYITSEEVITLLARMAGESKIIKDSVICLDGFTGFTPLQYQLLSELLRNCKKMYVTVTMDKRVPIASEGSPHQLFYMSRKTIVSLRNMALEQHAEVCEEIWTGTIAKKTRFAESVELRHLEKSLFRYPIKKYNKEVNDLSIHVLKQPKDEVSFVMQEIQYLLQEKQCRYKDIAIITGDENTYNSLLEEAFAERNYAGFIDSKKSVLANPFVDLLRSLTNIILREFDYESVMRYARNLFSGIRKEDADLLDNFLLSSGIRGYRKWLETWTTEYIYRSRSEEGRMYAGEHINQVRVQMIEEIGELYLQLAKGKHTVREYCVSYCSYMERMDLYHQIKQKEEKLLEEHDMAGAKEYGQIYNIVLDVFERLVMLLGEEEMSLSEFRDLLETGFEEARVGLIPPGVDQIVVGDISRTRLSNIKYMFFLGVNDSNIPQSTGDGGVISDVERSYLKEASYSLAPTAREQVYTEQFYLYLALTKPSKHLYLTYSTMGNDGKVRNPSYLIERIKLLYPMLTINIEEGKKDVKSLLSDDKGKKYLIQGLRQGLEEENWWKEIYRQYAKDENEQEWVHQMVNAAFYQVGESAISKEVAKALYYDKEMVISTSQIEKYAACAFSYFMKYGLCLEERPEHKVAFFDIGNIIHEALEKYTNHLIETKKKWQDLSEEEQIELANDCLDYTTAEYKDGLLYDTSRDIYLMTRIRRILQRTVWAITEQMSRGDFKTVETEVKFSFVDQVQEEKENDAIIKLIGKIDRMDIAEDEDKLYVKVVDYKTGKKNISLNDLYEGLQMQLVVYLHAGVQKPKRKKKDQTFIIPAGILYYNVEDPILEGDVSEDDREEQILAALSQNGLVNQDDPVLPYMDHCFQGKELPSRTQSSVIPVKTDAKGGISKSSNVMTTEQFEDIMKFADKKLHELGGQILSGNTGIHPYRRSSSKHEMACDYCPYHSICGFDMRISGSRYRLIGDMSNDEAYLVMKQEIEEEEKEDKQDE